MSDRKLKIMSIGAHPDDPDLSIAGTIAKLAERGHIIKCLSVTNGNAGHYAQSGEELANRRYEETQASARVLGVTYDVMNNDDGRLMPTLENREDLMREIRKFNPDVVLTNRTNDYHADHRATATLVQDCSFLLAVPNVCPDTPAMDKAPVILFWADGFLDPSPFRPDIVVPTDAYQKKRTETMLCHVSQTLEWLPWIDGIKDFPSWPLEKRREYAIQFWSKPKHISDAVYRVLCDYYGADYARDVHYYESFQRSEYGTPMTDEIRDIFMEL